MTTSRRAARAQLAASQTTRPTEPDRTASNRQQIWKFHAQNARSGRPAPSRWPAHRALGVNLRRGVPSGGTRGVERDIGVSGAASCSDWSSEYGRFDKQMMGTRATTRGVGCGGGCDWRAIPQVAWWLMYELVDHLYTVVGWLVG